MCLAKKLATLSQVDIGFTLDEDPQGNLTFTLQLGSHAPYCMSFGGTLVKDQDVNEKASGVGVYKRKNAPPGTGRLAGPRMLSMNDEWLAWFRGCDPTR